MDSEIQYVYDRIHLYQLKREHPDWSTRQLAQEVNRSERWVRKWCERFQSEKYHRKAGADLIAHYLLKDEALQLAGYRIPTSKRTITQVLHERQYIQAPPKRERNPLPLEEPMEEWEMDFAEIRLADGRFEFFLVVDRGTSRVVYLEGGTGYRSDTAILAMFRLLVHYGIPKRLRFDRDPRLVGSWTSDGHPSPFVRALHAFGIEPVICPPRRPDKKPYVERCIRTLKEEWLDRFSLNTLADCYEALEAFEHYYNSERVHMGRACNGCTPDEAFPRLPRLPELPQTVNPNAWLQRENGRVFRRRIHTNGIVQVDKHRYYVGEKWRKRMVLVHLDANNRCLWVTIDGVAEPRRLEIQGLHPQQLGVQEYLKILQEEARQIAHYRQMMWMKTGDVA